jgi:hypothetical protein
MMNINIWIAQSVSSRPRRPACQRISPACIGSATCAINLQFKLQFPPSSSHSSSGNLSDFRSSSAQSAKTSYFELSLVVHQHRQWLSRVRLRYTTLHCFYSFSLVMYRHDLDRLTLLVSSRFPHHFVKVCMRIDI